MGLLNIFARSKKKEKLHPVSKSKVLIVEDELYLRDFYQELLEGEGYDIRTATNGKDALILADRWQPQVIFLDVMMPVMDGLHVLDALKKSTKTQKIPVIMLTNAGNIENMENAKSNKAFRFLIKSNVPPEIIIRTTRDALSYNTSIAS